MEKTIMDHCLGQADSWGEREIQKLTGKIGGGKAEGFTVYNLILDRSQGGSLNWLYHYGIPVTKAEEDLAIFMFALGSEKLRTMAEHIIAAFLHGFVSQGRNRRDRRRVLVYYQIGLEALVKQLLPALEERGLRGVLQKPEGLFYRSFLNKRHCCLVPGMSAALSAALIRAYGKAATLREDVLRDCCGMISLNHFGEKSLTDDSYYKLNPKEQIRFQQFTEALGRIDRRYLAPHDLSFCKITFPNPLALNPAAGGDDGLQPFGSRRRFLELFEDFWQLNLENSAPFEQVQQVLIDVLDRCEMVRISGISGNTTDLTVALPSLEDPAQQSKFLNCGGDLNIPHGEIFTTPRLAGTAGRLHISRIYLNGVGYRDLFLVFQEGRLIDYGCGNFSDPKENRRLIKERLLDIYDTLPMGEFAIGTNTRAYTLIRHYGLSDRIPILLAEKTGPHIALGDPCFARGEWSPLYNLLDNKEMIARWNEDTASGIYTNRHTDITIPFDEIGLLEGIDELGNSVPIIKNGRFELPGIEILNRGFGVPHKSTTNSGGGDR
jgi:hypothetical protein